MRAVLGAALLIVFPTLSAASQDEAAAPDPFGLSPGEYSVGFRLLEDLDSSRAVTGGSSPPTTHPRPIRTYLWYPAAASDGAQPMLFGRYVTLADEDIWPAEIVGALRGQLRCSRRPLARSLGSAGFESLRKRPVFASEGAKPLAGPFPLIVIGQGLYYESPVAFSALAEYLASRGFVVATCPLAGTNLPLVRIDLQGLETQIRDLEFVIARARRLSFVSRDRLGVFGFDMGGMAALILAMRNPDVDALVTVSSGILGAHPSGLPASSPHYDPRALRIPWLHSISRSWLDQGPASLEGSLFEKAVHSDRYLLLTDGMGHVDYTSYALVEGRAAVDGYWAAADPGAVEGHKAVSRYVSSFFATFLMQDPESLAFLSQDPGQAIPGSTMTLEHRPAAPASITYEEFVRAVLAGEADDAIQEVRGLREAEPDHVLLDEEYLRRLVSSLSNTWGLTEEALPVVRFWAELYPESVRAQWMLAEAYIRTRDFPAAIEVYTRLLERNPDDDRARSRLEWLHSR